MNRKISMVKKNLLILMLFCVCLGGCGGLLSSGEKTIPAEFDLVNNLENKVAVVVTSPAWLSRMGNLRYYVTEAVNYQLMSKLELSRDQVVSYNDIIKYTNVEPGKRELRATEAAAKAGADLVVVVEITGGSIVGLGGADLYRCSLESEAMVYETATGRKLWPEKESSRTVKVGYEAVAGKEAALKRVGSATSYCVVRYFYECSKQKFKISGERKDFEIEDTTNFNKGGVTW